MSKPIEVFTHKIRVGWADCDPALIVYTGRIPYFALEAIDAWWEKYTGKNVFELSLDRDIGTPFVHMSIDFVSPVTPRHELVCEVKMLKLGNSSIRFLVAGSQADKLCFTGEFVTVVTVAKSMKPRRPPEEIVEKIQHLEVKN